MEDPFADMRRVREEREQREAQERQEREKKYEVERIAAERRKKIAFECDQMVRTPLEQLREAIYPKHQVIGCYEVFPHHLPSSAKEHNSSWGIGEKATCVDGCGSDRDQYDCWREAVRIDLEFDTANQPSHFICTRNARYKRQKPTPPLPPPKKTWFGRSDKMPATPQRVEYEDVRFEPLVVELSQEALVEALKKLHPAGSY